jgi:hypothetical protein
MHRSLISVVVMLLTAAVTLMPLSASAAPEESRDGKVTPQRTKTPVRKHIARPHQDTSCAQFGAGFMRLPGSDSCVRFGGGVGMGVGAVP